jgi:isochorismate synthase
MAMGTQKNLGLDEVIWQKKEMEEQQFVTDFILNNLKNLTSEVDIKSLFLKAALCTLKQILKAY